MGTPQALGVVYPFSCFFLFPEDAPWLGSPTFRPHLRALRGERLRECLAMFLYPFWVCVYPV
jgi:hypothetical protein